jgi:hypothetical protein
MESKIIFLKTSFADFYGPNQTNVKQYEGLKYTVTLTPTDQNVYVYNCVFQYCLSSSNGGALSCSSNIYKLLVEQSSFISCRTECDRGGGVFFDSATNGECILSKICGFNCSSTISNSNWSGGQCVYACIKNNVAYKNHVYDSSIIHTSTKGTNARYALELLNGDILCPSVNLTNNVCYHYTALFCSPATGTGSPVSETYCISYSSFVNNTTNGGYSCIYLSNSASSQRIDTSNIINNKQTVTSTYGTLLIYSNLLIKDSCILGNNEKNKVFYSASNKITISNCTVDDDIFTSGRYYGSVTVVENIVNTFINALSHIATQRCDSYFDSYGTLTVKPNTPSRNSPCLMTCNSKCPTIDALRFVQFLFLLTFLPSGHANDDYFR